MRIPAMSPVVVGVTGSPAGLAAVRLGAREAVSRGCPLRVVHAFTWPHPRSPGGGDYAGSRRAASQVVDAAVATAQRSTPGVQVAGQLLDGLPARVLVQVSRSAALLVLGDDDLATSARLPTSSAVVQTAARAWCPVVVARGPRPPAGPVLAAVDGSEFAQRGLRHAVAEAHRRQVPIEVVYVVAEPGARAEERGRRILAEAVDAVPELTGARLRLLTGAPAGALIRASVRARMIVLGPRGAGGSTLLGPVAREVLRRGACPTLFAHGPVTQGQGCGPVTVVPRAPAGPGHDRNARTGR
ncbi:universal stress protein [Micromonosporaceae bacterium Da 78-11]